MALPENPSATDFVAWLEGTTVVSRCFLFCSFYLCFCSPSEKGFVTLTRAKRLKRLVSSLKNQRKSCLEESIFQTSPSERYNLNRKLEIILFSACELELELAKSTSSKRVFLQSGAVSYLVFFISFPLISFVIPDFLHAILQLLDRPIPRSDLNIQSQHLDFIV